MNGALVVIGVWLVLIVMITAMLQRRARDRRCREKTWEAEKDDTEPRPGRAGCGGGGSCGGGGG